jgi:hypothetical protein
VQGVRRADEALIMLKAGAIQGISIGYREVDVEPADAGGPAQADQAGSARGLDRGRFRPIAGRGSKASRVKA